MALKSIGYKSLAIDGLPFDNHNGIGTNRTLSNLSQKSCFFGEIQNMRLLPNDWSSSPFKESFQILEVVFLPMCHKMNQNATQGCMCVGGWREDQRE